MAQRVYVKVVGFADEERHALNTLFRLSEQCMTMYQPWSPTAREAARLALLDGSSYEARLEVESPANADVRMLWIGDDPPPQVWRSFPRPVAWTEVIEGMDALFQADELDFDLDLGTGIPVVETQPGMSLKRALIVSPNRDQRLYLRARLSLAHLTLADEAESGAQAMEAARTKKYDFAVLDFTLPDMDAWDLLRQLREGQRRIEHIGMLKSHRSLPEHVRAWLGGAEAFLDQPPDPERLERWLQKL